MIGTWLEEVLSSRAKAKVLRLLAKFPAKEYTGREMARALGLSHRTVDLALRDLAAYALVALRRIGGAERKLAALGLRVSERFSLRPAPILLTPRELRRKWNAPHVVAAREHGLLVAGRPLEEVHAEAA